VHSQPQQSGLTVNGRLIAPEGAIDISFSNSSGPGGQNVNKRATKCTLRVPLAALLLSPAQAQRLAASAKHLLTDSGDLLIQADEYRSQERNKEACEERLADLVRPALVAPKVRRATKPSKGAQRRRIEEKKSRGEIKKNRGRIDD
jgi:ribosome-associated protein